MSSGYLIVEVFVSRAVLPLANARVYIANDDNTKLIKALSTDYSGRTERIIIDTPPREVSLHPSDVKPFTSVNVYATLEDYYNVLIRGVQVFEGEVSIQPVQMIPLPINYTGTNTEVIDITPQNL